MNTAATNVKQRLSAGSPTLRKLRNSRHAASVDLNPAAASSTLQRKSTALARRSKPTRLKEIEVIVLHDEESDPGSDSDSDLEIIRYTPVEHKKCEVIELPSDSEDEDEGDGTEKLFHTFARQETPPPSYEVAARQRPAAPCANPQPRLLRFNDAPDQFFLCMPRKRIYGNSTPHPWPNEPSKYRYPMTLATLPELPPLPPQWAVIDGKIRWNRSHDEFLLHARLGDARLEHLVPFVLLVPHSRAMVSKRTVIHFLTNQVLGVLAFAYHIEFPSMLDTLHTYADAMEAFIETIFYGENDNTNNVEALEWLVALWSPAHFPLLEKDLEDPTAPVDIQRCWALWQGKRNRWLPTA